MIVKLEKNLSLHDIEVLIRYAHMNPTVEKLQTLIQSVDKSIRCSLDKREFLINASSIYYIESVDKHTFVYCEDQVYDCDERLYQLIDALYEFGFIQVNKSCLINLHYLESIKPLMNSRLEAVLSSGERIYVTRRYVAGIRNQLERRSF